jgi:hypothetical protein
MMGIGATCAPEPPLRPLSRAVTYSIFLPFRGGLVSNPAPGADDAERSASRTGMPAMTVSRHAPRPSRWRAGCRTLAAAALLAALPFDAGSSEELVKAGTISIEQVQIAWIGSGNVGGGKLDFKGKVYNFSIGGLGVGGFGVSKITATGEVFNMTDVTQFPGAYGQGRYGFAAGDVSKGELWLKNPNGVVLHLKAQRVGLALSMGADAIYIKMD